ncbi:sialidase family protein [Gimesia fumaroli]|uniref:BNR/Asp-box repeat protein n=1 Tax=Gimesia fumaroli TaxID=2527976 RepID=A0A518I9F0_9PLAN|nr:sialidase family protein [Gimesia fumaroli]QDV49679.1 BNR/Asp-box repeat protein [Gimesia fumaroli]
MKPILLFTGIITTTLLATNLSLAEWNHPQTQKLPHQHLGPFLKLSNDSLLAPDDKQVLISQDAGKTWSAKPLYAHPEKFQTSRERAIIQTRKGTIILAFMNLAEKKFHWDDSKGGPQSDCYLPAYIVRSTDGGQTWLPPQIIQDDSWCGAIRSIIQTKSGRIIVAVSKAIANPGRHVMLTYYSDDEGATWNHSNMIDLGGSGDHDGAMEGTIVELKDGRIYALIRTRFGCFWEAFSTDEGASWRTIRPSQIPASSSPAILKRLESGRIVMLWNRFRDPKRKRGRREELSLAFSDDECKTWSAPVIIARDLTPAGQKRENRVSYPYVTEVKPGELWITTMQGPVRLSLKEADFIAK